MSSEVIIELEERIRWKQPLEATMQWKFTMLPPKCKILLDLGCGKLLPYHSHLKKRGETVIYADVCKSPYLTIRLDAQHLPFRDKSISFVWCVPGETTIFGDNMNIAELSLSNSCVNMKGEKQKIKKIYKRAYIGEMIRLRVLGLPGILLTPEHLVLTCKIGRVYKTRKDYFYKRSKLVWKPAKELETNDWVLVPRNKKKEKVTLVFEHEFPPDCGLIPTAKSIELDEDMSRIFGLYVAEGYTTNQKYKGVKREGVYYRTNFALGSHETELIANLKSLLEKVFHLRVGVFTKGSSALVYFQDNSISVFLRKKFGQKSKDKKVPKFIKDAEHEIIRSFIRGVWLGDGNINKGRVRITTVSKRLAYDLMELLYKIGITPTLSIRKIPKTGYIKNRKVNRRTPYVISFPLRYWLNLKDKKGRKPYLRSRIDKDYMYLPIRNIKKEKFNGLVYNLETEDNTFSIPFVVHNCSELLEHLENPQQAVNEMIRVSDNVLIFYSTQLHVVDHRDVDIDFSPFEVRSSKTGSVILCYGDVAKSLLMKSPCRRWSKEIHKVYIPPPKKKLVDLSRYT